MPYIDLCVIPQWCNNVKPANQRANEEIDSCQMYCSPASGLPVASAPNNVRAQACTSALLGLEEVGGTPLSAGESPAAGGGVLIRRRAATSAQAPASPPQSAQSHASQSSPRSLASPLAEKDVSSARERSSTSSRRAEATFQTLAAARLPKVDSNALLRLRWVRQWLTRRGRRAAFASRRLLHPDAPSAEWIRSSSVQHACGGTMAGGAALLSGNSTLNRANDDGQEMRLVGDEPADPNKTRGCHSTTHFLQKRCSKLRMFAVKLSSRTRARTTVTTTLALARMARRLERGARRSSRRSHFVEGAPLASGRAGAITPQIAGDDVDRVAHTAQRDRMATRRM
eukprot:CAMPEP_0202781990 /NCGR_PEP_ID=MMETSP1388-20130828/61834_1 /ASSEMBLY_ACC=CAM_ASM_000864 /TAXON_ID=37098 /ORGANISM="Isochrysis sp, Strain CCMP1244" /LENGTH=340 /DNA_ID=CAMNT_0049451419 /DNA_START=274 /DNA_END=1295 /DNA_ORIENTATION=+